MSVLKDIFSLEGRVALVTGGSRGIGKMIAAGLIEAGAKVYVVSRKAAACEETARELGPNCIALPANLATAEGIADLAAAFGAKESRLDILINNAGIAWLADFDKVTMQEWDRVLDVNLKSPFFVTQALHPLLCASVQSTGQRAKVINTASIDGMALNPVETYSYHASKAGLIYLTRRMAARLIADGIVVNAISPGAFGTDMNRLARDHPEIPASMTPAGRIGEPADIAAAALYLAARSGDFVIGTNLVVDGGVAYAAYGRNRPE